MLNKCAVVPIGLVAVMLTLNICAVQVETHSVTISVWPKTRIPSTASRFIDIFLNPGLVKILNMQPDTVFGIRPYFSETNRWTLCYLALMLECDVPILEALCISAFARTAVSTNSRSGNFKFIIGVYYQICEFLLLEYPLLESTEMPNKMTFKQQIPLVNIEISRTLFHDVSRWMRIRYNQQNLLTLSISNPCRVIMVKIGAQRQETLKFAQFSSVIQNLKNTLASNLKTQ